MIVDREAGLTHLGRFRPAAGPAGGGEHPQLGMGEPAPQGAPQGEGAARSAQADKSSAQTVSRISWPHARQL